MARLYIPKAFSAVENDLDRAIVTVKDFHHLEWGKSHGPGTVGTVDPVNCVARKKGPRLVHNCQQTCTFEGYLGAGRGWLVDDFNSHHRVVCSTTTDR